MSKCPGCPRPMTGKEIRDYEAIVKRLGGHRSKAGKEFIESEHQRFKANVRAHNRQAH